MRSFAASYDRTTLILSFGFVLFCVGMMLFAPVPWWSTIVLVLAVAISYGLSPRSYTIESREIRVHRLLGDKTIPLEDVTQARAADPDEIRSAIRLWGNGGLFGYYGIFRNGALGLAHWYLTKRTDLVVVTAGGRTSVFSPDDRNGFLDALRSEAPVTRTGVVSQPGGGWRLTWLWALLVAVTIGVVAAVVFYAPGPPRFTLTRQSLTIHDRFYPVTMASSAVDLAGIRMVDLPADPEWRPTARTNGFANAHYHSGWFRVVSGRTVRLYRADGRKVVLLPPKGSEAPVLLEVADPEGFIRQVREEWR